MGLNAIGVACREINTSIKFYELLGLNFEKIGQEHFEAKTQSGLRVMLDSFELFKKINPSWQGPVNSGIMLCFDQETPEKVDDLYKKIIECGFKSIKAPWDAFWGQRYASVQDPDGNQVDIFAQLQNK